VSNVITVRPETSVREVANLLLTHRISALPVVDEAGELVGIISEGDLIRRAETDTERRRSWWLELLIGSTQLAAEYARAQGRRRDAEPGHYRNAGDAAARYRGAA